MKSTTTSTLSVMVGIAAIGLGAIVPTISRAHCDTLDGPVVTEAKVALEKGHVTPVLKWVKKDSTIPSRLWVLIMSMQNELRLFEGEPQPPVIDQESH